MQRMALSAALAAALGLASARAEARTVRDEPYSLDSTWSTVVRMVRVDFGFTIDERDRDLGYFTFQYREGRRSLPGSVELMRSEVDGRPCTRVVVHIAGMPNYVETMMLSHLSRKLRAELGEAPPPPPRHPAQPPASGDHPPDGAQPAQPSQPGAPPSQPGSSTPGSSQPGAAQPNAASSSSAPSAAGAGVTNPNAVITLSNARWEPPHRIRYIDDFDD